MCMQTRTVTCQTNLGQPAGSRSCNSLGAEPLKSQACAMGACKSYSWVPGNWGACSVTCASGTRTRAVPCKDQFDVVAADGNCAGSGRNPVVKPITQEPCVQPECKSYSFVPAEWGACVASNGRACGAGVRKRTVSCQDDKTRLTVVETLCNSRSGKPESEGK